MVYFKNESGTGVVFLALCMYLMVIIDNSLLFCLYIFVLEDLAFFPTVLTLDVLDNRCLNSKAYVVSKNPIFWKMTL